MRSNWLYLAMRSERHNEPGVFSAFAGWEWTARAESRNLHRVVFSPAPAEALRSFFPFSSLDSERPEDLLRRAGVEERPDERLHRRQRSVRRARVAPALQEVRLRDHPAREPRRDVRLESDVNQLACPRSERPEVLSEGRRVRRVAAEDDERVDRARFEGARAEGVNSFGVSRVDLGRLLRNERASPLEYQLVPARGLTPALLWGRAA